MAYLKWDQKTITDLRSENIENEYEKGFLFGRIGKGVVDQTRSVRIDLDLFDLTSENRRVLKKTDGLLISNTGIPYQKYDWTIGKLAKDFYDTKFGEKTFSANKTKELLTDQTRSNFNKLLTFSFAENIVGYAICFNTENILHYCYPFYDLNSTLPNLGMGMMLRAVLWAKETNKKYIYLGSAQRPGDTYKLQFEGLEWFDGKTWQNDIKILKEIISK